MLELMDFDFPVVQILIILLGVVVLIAGRRLFWLTVGAVGFITGLVFAFLFLEDQQTWLRLALAIIAGGVGIVAALFLQKIAIGIAGFLMGAYALVWVAQQFAPDMGNWTGVVFIIGGVIGALLISAVFDIALIVLSALTGAALVVYGLPLNQAFTAGLFLILVVAGVAIQSTTRG